MKKNTTGNILLVIGVIIVIVSLLSDIIGIANIVGLSQDPIFGPIQISGLVFGVILASIGWYLKGRK
ncbi:MAG: hypothetical protein ACFFKA_16330 [Candidatus Thorarchaeota archaeon]